MYVYLSILEGADGGKAKRCSMIGCLNHSVFFLPPPPKAFLLNPCLHSPGLPLTSVHDSRVVRADSLIMQEQPSTLFPLAILPIKLPTECPKNCCIKKARAQIVHVCTEYVEVIVDDYCTHACINNRIAIHTSLN